MRLVRLFLKALRGHPAIADEVLAPLFARDPDERMAIDALHELLRGAVLLTKDEDLGLRAARAFEPGEMGALEFVASSSSTVRDAIDMITRYLHLMSDAVSVSIETRGARTFARLDNAVALDRVTETFELGVFHMAMRCYLGGPLPSHELYFRHARPADLREYERTFIDVPVLFDHAFTGCSFDSSGLELALPSHDKHLHLVLRKHADYLLSELPRVESVATRVRAEIMRELASGKLNASRVAHALHVSVRSLARRLDAEGTSFRELLEESRRNLAVRYAGATDIPVSEMTSLLGFSSVHSFYRAFRKWTGSAPSQYRRAHRG